MTHSDFNHLLASVDALSPDQLRQLLRELESRVAATRTPPAPARPNAGRDAEETAYDVASRAGLIGCLTGAAEAPDDLTEEELADQAMQRRPFDAGLLSEIKPPIRDLTPYRNRQAVPIQGEPLSETVIRERR